MPSFGTWSIYALSCASAPGSQGAHIGTAALRAGKPKQTRDHQGGYIDKVRVSYTRMVQVYTRDCIRSEEKLALKTTTASRLLWLESGLLFRPLIERNTALGGIEEQVPPFYCQVLGLCLGAFKKAVTEALFGGSTD
jgi:hypothetical protein